MDLLSLSFDVQVEDIAPANWIIENIAFVTAFLNPLDIAGSTIAVVETNLTQVEVVPEPSTVVFFGIGLFGMIVLVRRKRHMRK